MPPDTFLVLVPLGGMATGLVFMFGAYKLIVRWMDRRHAVGGSSEEDVRQLRAHVEALEGLAGRVAELEERVDFAERLLAQHRRDGLPGSA